MRSQPYVTSPRNQSCILLLINRGSVRVSDLINTQEYSLNTCCYNYFTGRTRNRQNLDWHRT